MQGRPAPGRGARAPGTPGRRRLARTEPAWFPLVARALRAVFFPRVARARRSRRARRDVLADGGPALDGARGPVFHLCQGYEGEIAYYRTEVAEIEADLPRADAQARDLGDAGRAARGPRIRPGDRRGAGLRREGFFPAPARPAGRSAGRARGRSDRGRVQGNRDRARGPRGLARARRALPPPAGLVLARARRGGARAASPTSTTTASRPSGCPSRTAPRTSSSRPRRVEEGFGLPALEALACGVAGAALRRSGPARDRRRRRLVLPRRRPGESGRGAAGAADRRGARAGARRPGPRRGGALRHGRAWRSGSRARSGAPSGTARDARASPSSSSTTAAPREAAACVRVAARGLRARGDRGGDRPRRLRLGAGGGPGARGARGRRRGLPSRQPRLLRRASTRASRARAPTAGSSRNADVVFLPGAFRRCSRRSRIRRSAPRRRSASGIAGGRLRLPAGLGGGALRRARA